MNDTLGVQIRKVQNGWEARVYKQIGPFRVTMRTVFAKRRAVAEWRADQTVVALRAVAKLPTCTGCGGKHGTPETQLECLERFDGNAPA